MPKLKLSIVSQRKKLEDIEVDSITVGTSMGEITVLPKHIPLFAQLTPCELIYRINGKEESIVISSGFIDVGPDSKVTIIVDSLNQARNLSVAKAEEAVRKAIENLEQVRESGLGQEEFLRVEASLKQALLEEKIARKTSKVNI